MTRQNSSCQPKSSIFCEKIGANGSFVLHHASLVEIFVRIKTVVIAQEANEFHSFAVLD